MLDDFKILEDQKLMVCLQNEWLYVDEIILLKHKVWFVKADVLLAEISHDFLVDSPVWKKLLPIVLEMQNRLLEGLGYSKCNTLNS